MARQRRSRGQWRRLVEGRARSGLTQQAHCDRHGISLGSLYRWREIFREEGVGGAPAEPVRLVPGGRKRKGLKRLGSLVPYPGNLEQNGKDFNEEAQETPDPKSGDPRLGSCDPTEGTLRLPVPAQRLVMCP